MSDFVIAGAAAPEDAANDLLDAAFGPLRRMKTSYRLREGARPVFSFSAHEAATGRLAGVVSLWPLRIGQDGHEALLLGPLAVHPDFHGRGLGGRLMAEALAAARAGGQRLILLVGDGPYYGRFGFQPVPEGQLLMPGPFDPHRLLALELVPGALAGARGLVLPAHRWVGKSSAALEPPGQGEQQKGGGEHGQGGKEPDAGGGDQA